MSGAPIDCPRCGYSQAGLFQSDADAWPLESCCAECGLTIRWSDYFLREQTLPRRWIEHCSWRRIPIAFLLTILASCLGWPLWHRLRMTHEIRPLRLLLALLLLVLMMLSIGVARMAISEWKTLQSQIASRGLIVPTTDFDESEQQWVRRNVTAEPISQLELLRAVTTIVIKPWSSDRPAIRSSAVLPDRNSLDACFRSLQAGQGPTPISRSRRTVTMVYADQPIAHWERLKRSAFKLAGFPLAACGLTILSFAFLPIARRRAKVRLGQLLRCSAYLFLGPWLLLLFASWSGWVNQEASYVEIDLTALMLLMPIIAIFFVWWYQAAGRYLRMQRPAAVAGSVTVIAVLGAATLELAMDLL